MTDPHGLVVRGGPAGTAARLEDLDRAGAQLQAAGRVMASVAVRAARVAADPRLAVTGPLSPATWSVAERQLARAVGPPAGAVVVAARLTGLGAAARGASDLYRTADAAAAVGLHAVDAAVGRAVGGLLAVPVIAAVTSPVAITVAAAGITATAADGRGRGDVTALLLGLIGAHTGGVEHAVDALPSAIGGLLGVDPLLAIALFPLTGTPTVPPDVPGGARWLGRVASVGPWLRESTALTVVAVRPVEARPPGGTAELLRGVATLEPHARAPGSPGAPGAPPGTVRVVAVTGPDGRRAWIVQVPGTQDWSPRAGRNPFDLTGNIHGMAGSPTAGRRLVEAAMRSAGARPGEPVLLAGHSQGGLVAAQLAADPQFRATYRVTHVVTAGAPVGSVRIPDSVAVLSLEHDEDVVPRLDGGVNPDRPGWLTVSRPTTADGGLPSPSVAHDLSTYAKTAAQVDAATHPALVRWREGLGPFLAGEGVNATALEVTGVKDSPPGPS